MQNSVFVNDLVVDTVYETIKRYVPQIVAARKNIKVEQTASTLYITIDFQYITDKTLDTISIELVEQ